MGPKSDRRGISDGRIRRDTECLGLRLRGSEGGRERERRRRGRGKRKPIERGRERGGMRGDRDREREVKREKGNKSEMRAN